MSSGRKPTIAWVTVVAITISMSGTSAVHAQKSSSPSLMDRFSSFKGIFKRDEPTTQKSTTQKLTTNSSRQTSSGSKNGRPRYGSKSRSAANIGSRTTSSAASQPKVGINNLLPNNIFGRKKPSSENGKQQPQISVANPSIPRPQIAVVDDNGLSPTDSVSRTASRARMGSTVGNPSTRTRPRRSPKTNRHDNLNETLSDLLENEAIISEQVVVEVDESFSSEAVISDRGASVSEELAVDGSTVSDQIGAETRDAIADDPQPTVSLVDPEQAIDASQKDPVAIAAEEATGRLSPEPVAIASNDNVNEPVTVEEKPFAHKRIDLHDALLSDELYEDWSAEVAAPEEVSVDETEDEFFVDETESIAAPKADSSPPEIVNSLKIEDLIEANIPLAGEEQSAPFDQVVEIPEPIEALPEPQPAHENEPRPITRLHKLGSDVLVSTEQPVIVSHVEGPRSILVGREASYRVTLENTSRTPAHNLVAAIHVPDWADLVALDCTRGVVEQIKKDAGGLEWRLPELAAHSSQTLSLRLIPRSGREFQLGVQWSQESAESLATVEVREPKLEMKISGPQDVLFGTPQRYQLTLSNPGTGLAEGVAVSLIPPGSDSASATTHVVGTLGPEEVKELELELTAREAGELILQATATAEGGLETEVIKRVLCRKPELEVDWRGPDQKYAGTETAYYFRVRNSGTATTEPVEVKVRLPEGIRFLSASDSYAVDAATGVVTWRMSKLSPGEEQFVQFHCVLDRPGLKEFDVTARTIDGEVYDTTSVRTEVVALADLKLEVNDPRGARPVGEPVLYEIRVVNSGTTNARGIAIVGLFSEGIDPVSVEGAQNSVREGRVTFQTVKSLPAGGEILLRIRAVASQVGTHIFRAEVACEDLDIRLAAEETTRFFEDEYHWNEGETPYTAEKNSGTKVR